MTARAAFALDHADMAVLRESLRKLAAAGYCESCVRERLGLEDLADLQWRLLPIYRAENLRARDALALAIDLFLLQGSLAAAELACLFTPTELDVLVRAGLVAVVSDKVQNVLQNNVVQNNDQNASKNDLQKDNKDKKDDPGLARACASLFPVGERLIFSDHAWPELPHPGYARVPCDHVMAIGPDSRKLARCTVRRRFRGALDLCTGSGVQALLASAHSGHVIAVDVNPRAAQCARFNAQASGATNLEVVVGDLFDAVRGERFDLITANPPFVPSPADAVQFRDGGRSGEDIQKRIVAGLPHHLAPGGIAQMVTELGEREGEPLVRRLREWLNGAAMDIHILRLGEHAAAKYATGHANGDTYEAFLDSASAWARNLRAQGYVRVVSLVVSFQWSDRACGPPWERVDESPPPHRCAGHEIDAVFFAERWTRQRHWQQILQRSWLRRAGPIAILDAQLIGADLRANKLTARSLRSKNLCSKNLQSKISATLLGQALKIDHPLDPLERDILQHINIGGDSNRNDDGRIPVPDLIASFCHRNIDEPSILAAARSLLRRQLVRIELPENCTRDSDIIPIPELR